MSTKGFATSIHNFCVNPALQSSVVNDESMLQALLTYTSDSDPETVLISVESFHALSKVIQHRATLNSLVGLSVRLAELCEYDEGDNKQKVCAIAKETLNYLSAETANANSNYVERVALPTVTAVRAGAFGSRGYMHPVTIHVSDLNTDEHRAAIEKALIGTKGLVSVTIDMQLRNVNLFTNTSVDEFVPSVLDVIAKAGHKGVHITTTNDVKKETASGKPGYATKPTTGGKDSLVRYVDKNAKKKEAPKEGGWIGGITSYFW